ncbi:hypothetical protein M432DRAFT_55531 [Thermoascus aurantiacus ATCC 26904]
MTVTLLQVLSLLMTGDEDISCHRSDFFPRCECTADFVCVGHSKTRQKSDRPCMYHDELGLTELHKTMEAICDVNVCRHRISLLKLLHRRHSKRME